MRVFAVSDLHLEHEANRRWLEALSTRDYQDDVLILAGDVAEGTALLTTGFEVLARRFRQVAFVPGNHDLWVDDESQDETSFDKLERVLRLAEAHGIATTAIELGTTTLVPLFGWYDYSFGEPSAELTRRWRDYRACRWPASLSAETITERFLALNRTRLQPPTGRVISFSHFLPRIDVMPDHIPARHRLIYPVLGTSRLDAQVAQLGAQVHVYGHSHVNRDVPIDGRRYINNAFGYPGEERFAARALRCVDGG